MGQAPATPLLEDVLELKAMLEQTWPTMHAALRASGVPLNEETDEEREARDAREAKEAAAAQKPPWGDDFDADRAWKLVQNLRGDAEKVKKDRDALAQQVRDREDAEKSEAQKLEERATTAERQAATAARDAARLRVALKKGLTETQAKRLVGDTEEELEQDADELLESFKTDDDDGQDPTRRPRERLRPGAVPSSEPEETDPRKLADLIPRR